MGGDMSKQEAEPPAAAFAVAETPYDTNYKRSVLEAVQLGYGGEQVSLVRVLDAPTMVKLLRVMALRRVRRGTVIQQQGEPVDTFYIIKSGVAQLFYADMYSSDSRGARVLAELHGGDFFGERALLQPEPAKAAVVAASDLDVFACKRQRFEDAVGRSLVEIIDAAIGARDAAKARPKGPQFSELELGRVLGLGTYGRVRVAVHAPTGEAYALKAMRKAKLVASQQVEHVLSERHILWQLEHPFIVRLVATYQSAGELYMLQELPLGGEFFSVLEARGPLQDRVACFFVAAIVCVVAYLHSRGVAYRDLKPENLLLDGQGYLKLCDFGFAKILDADAGYRTYTFVGTPDYVAPEVITKAGHGFGVDWWALGALAFECVTGRTPFDAKDPKLVYAKILRGTVPWPKGKKALGEHAQDLIGGLLTADVGQRLGCGGRGGASEVREHPWFEGVNFRALEARRLPAPYVPKLKSKHDDSGYKRFADEGDIGEEHWPATDTPKEVFAEFAEQWV